MDAGGVTAGPRTNLGGVSGNQSHNTDAISVRGHRGGCSMNLVCIEGETKDHVWQLACKRSVIGRSPRCDIVIDDPMLSRVHAEVICAGEAIIFVDRESQNGSYINGVRVTSQALLPGDVIRLGYTTLKAVEKDLSQEVCWDENAPFITRAISLDRLSEQVKEAALRDTR